jgi:hypothetical protein
LASFKNPSPIDAIGVTVDEPNSISTREDRAAWQRLIDDNLIEWGRHPEQFEDEDGYKAPTADNLVRATEFIAFCRDRALIPPLRMAPDGEGGIVFQWKDIPPFYYYVEIHADGNTELLIFQDCQLMVRQPIGGG